MNEVGFQSVLILLGVVVLLVAVLRRLHLPQILAYLSAGIIVGPHAFGWVSDAPLWHALGEFGLVFLMFTIGLEFSLPKLLAMRRIVFGLGGAQVVICCVVFAGAAWGFGVPINGALIIGGILAMSSTAIVSRLLIEQLEQGSRHGRYAIGVLLFQDLVVVPFLILVPALAGADANTGVVLGMALVKSVLVLTAMIAAGRWVLRPLFHRVAATRLREYFMLTVLLLTLAAAWLTEMAGLSLALGAFLAGMMFAETEYRHQVEADILPFRDLLLGLFFITVGMLFDLSIVKQQWLVISMVVLATLVFKTLLILGLGKCFRMETGVALRTGLVLAQGGEFGFALLLLATRHRVLDETTAQILLAAIVISMMLAPFVVWYNGYLARRLVPSYEQPPQSDTEGVQDPALAHRQHIIICGYGRSGQNLDWMLSQEGIPRLALDLDPVRVRDACDAGKPVVYGDATRRDVLEGAGLAHARALAVSFNDNALATKVLEIVRALRPDLPVIVRTKDDAQFELLMQAGASEVVPESLEGSLMMGSHLLLLLGVPASRVERYVNSVRRDRYRMLKEFFHGQFGEAEEEETFRERLHSVTLPEQAYAVGKRLRELKLDEAQVTVSALRRDGKQQATPTAELQLQVDDVLVLYGTPESLARAEELLLEGDA